MMHMVDYNHCTACGACIQVCPQKCIVWEKQEFGFRYPKFDESQCTKCGLCSKVCPIPKKPLENQPLGAYAAVHLDPAILQRSTSGGMFTAIATFVLAHNGFVYGCIMNENFNIHHIGIDDVEELDKLRGSKYVQSDTLNTYNEVKYRLNQGNLILYVGTPCQIAGLNKFLRKEYKNLITIDIICHGVGSQDYFSKFVTFLNQYIGIIKKLKFRDKKYAGWSCGGGGVYFDSKKNTCHLFSFPSYKYYYYQYFLSGSIYRMSCYSCPYASLHRQGDITLGDFWGVERLKLPIDTRDGCSLVLTNTDKGAELLKALKNIQLVPVSIKDAAKYNGQLSKPSKLSKNVRQELIHQYEVMDGAQIQAMYLKNHKKSILKGRLKACIPYPLKLKLRKWLQ